MSNLKTSIEWTDATWSPVVGCTRVSPGCDHCYASALHNRRYKANIQAALAVKQREPVLVRLWLATRRTIATITRDEGRWLPYPRQYDQPFGRVQLLYDRLDRPLHWRRPRRVFVNSMSDLFHPAVPDHFIRQVFYVMEQAAKERGHVFQVLTKRPERMRDFARAHWGRDGREATGKPFWRHIWLGVSVEDQRRADERIPLLLETPAAVRFVSCEPLLGPVDLIDPVTNYELAMDKVGGGEWDWLGHVFQPGERMTTEWGQELVFCAVCRNRETAPMHRSYQPYIDWVIVGGESGPRARPMHADWARSLRDQCQAAGVPFFMNRIPVRGLGCRAVSRTIFG